MLADPILVPVDVENAARLPISANKQLKFVDFVIEQARDTPTITKYEAASCSIIMETIRNRKIPDDIAEISMESWRRITHSKYEAILKKWKQHALSRNEDPIDTSHSYMECTLKAVYIVSCVELEAPYLVLYALRNFQSLQAINDLKISETDF